MEILKRLNEAVAAAGGDKDLARINKLRFLRENRGELSAAGVPVDVIQQGLEAQIRGPNARGRAPVYQPAEADSIFERIGAAVRYPEDGIDIAFGDPETLTGEESPEEAAGKIRKGSARAGAELGSFLGAGAALSPLLGPVGAGAMLIGAPLAKRAAEAAGLGESTMIDEHTGQQRDVTAADVVDEGTAPFAEWARIGADMYGARQARDAGVQGPEASPEFQFAKSVAEGRALHALAGLGMAANLSPTYRRGTAAASEFLKGKAAEAFPTAAGVLRRLPLPSRRRAARAEPNPTNTPMESASPGVPVEASPAARQTAAETLNALEVRVDALAEKGTVGADLLQRKQKELFRRYARNNADLDPAEVSALKAAVDQAEGVTSGTPATIPELGVRDAAIARARAAADEAWRSGDLKKIEAAEKQLARIERLAQKRPPQAAEVPPPQTAESVAPKVEPAATPEPTPAEAARTTLDAEIEAERVAGATGRGLPANPRALRWERARMAQEARGSESRGSGEMLRRSSEASAVRDLESRIDRIGEELAAMGESAAPEVAAIARDVFDRSLRGEVSAVEVEALEYLARRAAPVSVDPTPATPTPASGARVSLRGIQNRAAARTIAEQRLGPVEEAFGSDHPVVQGVKRAIKQGRFQDALEILEKIHRTPAGGTSIAEEQAYDRSLAERKAQQLRRFDAPGESVPTTPENRVPIDDALDSGPVPVKKKALSLAGKAALGASGAAGLVSLVSPAGEAGDSAGDENHRQSATLKDIDWTAAASAPLVGLGLLGRARGKLAETLRPITDRLAPGSRIPALPEGRARSPVRVGDLEALISDRETKVTASASYPEGMARIPGQANDLKGLPQNSSFYVKNGVIPAVLEHGAKVREFEQKVFDDVLAHGYGELDAEARAVRRLPEDVRRAMNLMIEGRPVPLAERLALEARPEADQLLGYVKRLRGFYRTVGEWRRARGEPVVEGDYVPKKVERWQSRLLDEVGARGRGPYRNEGSLSHERTSLFDPNRSPLDNFVDYVGDLKSKVMNETLITPIAEAAKRFDRAGFDTEASTLHEFIRGTLNPTERSWADRVLSDAIVSEIKAGARKVGPGMEIPLDGTWGLPEGRLEVKRAGGIGARGDNFYVEVNGKEWPHPYTSAELSFLKMSSTTAGRLRLKMMFGPVAGAIGAFTRLASFFSLWMNPRSVVSQTTGNVSRSLASEQSFKDMALGGARTMKLLKDYLTDRESIRDELLRLQRYELFESDALKMDNPTQTWEWVDRIFEAPVIRHGFWPIKAPDFAFKLATFYGAEARIARENRGWTRPQIERAAVQETLRTTDHTMRLLEAPHSRWAFQQMFMFLRKSQLRDLQQFVTLVRDGKHSRAMLWLAGKAGIGAGLYYAMGLDKKEIAEVVSRVLPFGDWLVRGGEFVGALERREDDQGEPLFPALDILGKKMWRIRDAAAQSLETGEMPTEAALKRALPAAFRTYQDVTGALLDESPEERQKHRHSLILHRAEEHRPAPHGIHGVTTAEEEAAKAARIKGLRRGRGLAPDALN